MTLEETEKYIELPFFTTVYRSNIESGWYVILNLTGTVFELELDHEDITWSRTNYVGNFLVDRIVSLQYVFENSPPHIQEQLIYHLDLFV